MAYAPRIADSELEKRLKSAGAVLVEGAKACGKTETARQVANSEVLLDVDKAARDAAELNPGLILLSGEIGGHPVLIDFVRQQLEGSEFAVTKISSGTPGNRAVLWGAISLALEAIPSVLLPQPEM